MQITKITVKITELFGLTNKILSNWLENELSQFGQDWWKSLVLSNLSHSQVKHVKRLKINKLAQLDLAALLRILDRNWYQISEKNNLSLQERNYVKEMQAVRNRWAHIGTGSIKWDDVYRDVDTIQRFLFIIEADENVLSDLQSYKKSIISKEFDKIPLIKDRGVESSERAKSEESVTQPLHQPIGKVVAFKPPQPVKKTATPVMKQTYASEPSSEFLGKQIKRVLATLTPFEEKAIRLKFGIGTEEGAKLRGRETLTYTDVADMLYCSPAKVSYWIKKALRKIKHPTRSRHLIHFKDQIDINNIKSREENLLSLVFEDKL